jgi:hypothetical protein
LHPNESGHPGDSLNPAPRRRQHIAAPRRSPPAGRSLPVGTQMIAMRIIIVDKEVLF